MKRSAGVLLRRSSGEVTPPGVRFVPGSTIRAEAAIVLGANGWKTFRRVTLPNVKWVGTFFRDGQRTYWNVRRGGQTVVIELDTRAPFARLYLSVDDGRALVDRINAAVTG